MFIDETILYPISGGIVTISACDKERLDAYTWHISPGRTTTYARRSVWKNGKTKPLYMHRFILSAQPGTAVDHIDGNGLNNSRSNIRLATPSQNAANQRPTRQGSSSYKGVSWDKARNKWVAQIHVNKKHIQLGRFKSEVEAAQAYDAAALNYFGEYACFNLSPNSSDTPNNS